MKKTLLLACLTLCASAGAGRIPGTQVSYKLAQDSLTHGNASMVFVDASEDPSGKTYMALVCDLGHATFRFYSKESLGRRAGEQLLFFFRADDQGLRTAEGTLREYYRTGKLSVLDFPADSPQLFQTFASAQKKVVVRVNRNSMASMTLTFPVKGFMIAYRAIGRCE